ncbi:MAG: hypothetical protein IPL79_19935 [Myxococcales bacterium]|nr:hypothetical protein [Myxococcales bacterium]
MRLTTREHVELLHDAVTAAHVACVVNGETHGSPDPATFRIWLFGAMYDPADAVVALARRIAAHPPAEQGTPKFQRLLDRMEDLAEVWPWWEVAL